MDWTVGTFWTVETDSRRIGLIGDRLDSWERRRPGGLEPGSAALGYAPSSLVFLGPFGPSRRS